jgi:hypothetical protein
MVEQSGHRHVEISDGEHTVAAADVTTSSGTDRTVRASLRAESGHIPPGSRASLVDAVLDLPELQAGTRLEAAFPLGDSESLHRLQERCEDVRTQAAGVSALVEADIPSGTCRQQRPPRAT